MSAMNLAVAPTTAARHWTPDEVLRLLAEHSYDRTSQMTGWSRGRIYALACERGARKHEARIQARLALAARERAAAEERLRQEVLAEVMNTTVKSDVLEFLDGLPTGRVGLHFTSVPYNLGKPYFQDAHTDRKAHLFYHGWLMQVISELARTTCEGGMVCLQLGKTRGPDGGLLPLDVMLFQDLARAGLTFQTRFIWTINHGLTPENRPAERYETILAFSKGPQPRYFWPTPLRTPQKDPGKRAFKGPNRGELSGNPLGAHPTDVWVDVPQVGHNHPERHHSDHPAPFPKELPRRAMLMYTVPGDLTCDVFCGTGASAEAAIETGRSFLGCDLFYERDRERRLSQARPDVVSPLPGLSDDGVAVWQAKVARVQHFLDGFEM